MTRPSLTSAEQAVLAGGDASEPEALILEPIAGPAPIDDFDPAWGEGLWL